MDCEILESNDPKDLAKRLKDWRTEGYVLKAFSVVQPFSNTRRKLSDKSNVLVAEPLLYVAVIERRDDVERYT
jgi:hypothetical protein